VCRPVEIMVEIDAALVRRLIAAQFPHFAHLDVRPVVPGGWDNRTFRLGGDLAVRLPSTESHVAQVAKEHRWLPVLAPGLPLPVPVSLAVGVPGEGYPWPWSVRRWIGGETADSGRVGDPVLLAQGLAGFLAALQDIDASDGPPAGAHNFHRGGSLAVYDDGTRAALEALRGEVDPAEALEVWDAALATSWQRTPVWVHGDVAAGNLLVRDGRLAAIIDFGCCGTGDPATDLVIAWTLLEGDARTAFRQALELDAATWARGRGWALWKALITMADPPGGKPALADAARLVVAEVLAEHRREDARR